MTKIRFVSPLYDSTFKWLWKKKNSREFFIRLIQNLTSVDLHDYELYDPELNSGNKIKDYRMDILFIRDKEEKSVNVEMYYEVKPVSSVKSYQYAFRILSDKLKEGKFYERHQLVQINFYNSLFKGDETIGFTYSQIQDSSGKYPQNYLMVYDVYLSKFKDCCYNKANELDAMLSFISCDSYDEMRRVANGNKEALSIVEDLEELAMQEEFIGVYDNEKQQRMLQNTCYRDGHEEGKEEGRKEGIQEGRKEGIQEGRKEGKQEAKIIIARNLLESNVDKELISKWTGLSIEEIDTL